MTKRKKPRKRRSIGDPRLARVIPVTYRPPISMGKGIEEAEKNLLEGFAREFPATVKLWADFSTLHGVLMEKRAAVDDASNLRTAMDLLGAKAFADARGAQVLLERGYAMASLGPLRAAQETTDLMRFLLLNPNEADAWIREDPKFDELGWVKERLDPVARESYSFMNWGIHPNWALIPEMLRKEIGPVDTEYELVAGPVRDRALTGALCAIALVFVLFVLVLLDGHSPSLVTRVWRDQLMSCSSRLNELFDGVDAKWRDRIVLRGALAEMQVREKELAERL